MSVFFLDLLDDLSKKGGRIVSAKYYQPFTFYFIGIAQNGFNEVTGNFNSAEQIVRASEFRLQNRLAMNAQGDTQDIPGDLRFSEITWNKQGYIDEYGASVPAKSGTVKGSYTFSGSGATRVWTFTGNSNSPGDGIPDGGETADTGVYFRNPPDPATEDLIPYGTTRYSMVVGTKFLEESQASWFSAVAITGGGRGGIAGKSSSERGNYSWVGFVGLKPIPLVFSGTGPGLDTHGFTGAFQHAWRLLDRRNQARVWDPDTLSLPVDGLSVFRHKKGVSELKNEITFLRYADEIGKFDPDLAAAFVPIPWESGSLNVFNSLQLAGSTAMARFFSYDGNTYRVTIKAGEGSSVETIKTVICTPAAPGDLDFFSQRAAVMAAAVNGSVNYTTKITKLEVQTSTSDPIGWSEIPPDEDYMFYGQSGYEQYVNSDPTYAKGKTKLMFMVKHRTGIRWGFRSYLPDPADRRWAVQEINIDWTTD